MVREASVSAFGASNSAEVRAEFNRVISHAIGLGIEAAAFLQCWREGDWSACAEFDFTPGKASLQEPSDGFTLLPADGVLEFVDEDGKRSVPAWTEEKVRRMLTAAPELLAQPDASVAPQGLCERICSAIKAADDKSVSEADYMLDSDDCIKIVREQFAVAMSSQPAQQVEPGSEIQKVAQLVLDAYCRGWQTSFCAANPYDRITITAASREHIQAGLAEALMALRALGWGPLGPIHSQQPVPVATQWLAEMIMSDCGCSTQNQTLLARITTRIEQYDRANAAPTQPAQQAQAELEAPRPSADAFERWWANRLPGVRRDAYLDAWAAWQARDALAHRDAQTMQQVSAMTNQADAHLRALLRYTEGFYCAAIEHGMKAGPTANAVAHVERAGRALHEIIHAQATMLNTAPTPPSTEQLAARIEQAEIEGIAANRERLAALRVAAQGPQQEKHHD